MTLLDGFFHMHGLGKSIITRRFRDGQELAPLAQLHADDYEFQGNTPIGPESRTLMPGDALTLQVWPVMTARGCWGTRARKTPGSLAFIVAPVCGTSVSMSSAYEPRILDPTSDYGRTTASMLHKCTTRCHCSAG